MSRSDRSSVVIPDPLNAEPLKFFTFDKWTVVKLGQSLNTSSGSDSIFSLNVTAFIPAPANAWFPMLTTCDKSIVYNTEHAEKASWSIVVSDPDMVTVSSLEHAWKAAMPICVTLGILTLCSEQPANACIAIFSTPFNWAVFSEEEDINAPLPISFIPLSDSITRSVTSKKENDWPSSR